MTKPQPETKAKTKMLLLRHIHYGRERLYPGCALSRVICKIKGGKTFNREEAIMFIREGQCEVNVKDIEERPVDGE